MDTEYAESPSKPYQISNKYRFVKTICFEFYLSYFLHVFLRISLFCINLCHTIDLIIICILFNISYSFNIQPKEKIFCMHLSELKKSGKMKIHFNAKEKITGNTENFMSMLVASTDKNCGNERENNFEVIQKFFCYPLNF